MEDSMKQNIKPGLDYITLHLSKGNIVIMHSGTGSEGQVVDRSFFMGRGEGAGGIW